RSRPERGRREQREQRRRRGSSVAKRRRGAARPRGVVARSRTARAVRVARVAVDAVEVGVAAREARVGRERAAIWRAIERSARPDDRVIAVAGGGEADTALADGAVAARHALGVVSARAVAVARARLTAGGRRVLVTPRVLGAGRRGVAGAGSAAVARGARHAL